MRQSLCHIDRGADLRGESRGGHDRGAVCVVVDAQIVQVHQPREQIKSASILFVARRKSIEDLFGERSHIVQRESCEIGP